MTSPNARPRGHITLEGVYASMVDGALKLLAVDNVEGARAILGDLLAELHAQMAKQKT